MFIKTPNPKEIISKKILLRIDINSAVVNGKPIYSSRFSAHAKTISYLLKNKAKLIILAHQGRKGDKDYLPSLSNHAKILGKEIGKSIPYIHDLFGKKAFGAFNSIKSGEAILLENVRNYIDEININKNNKYHSFSKLFDFYVNDAFSVCHRAHGSVVIPPAHIPGYSGPNLIQELNASAKFFHTKKTKKRIVYLLGGEKLDDYINLFKLLKNKKAKILASGVLGNGFLISNGHNLGYENIWLKNRNLSRLIPKLKSALKKYNNQIILPVDLAVGNPNIHKAKSRREIFIEQTPVNQKVWDIGHETVDIFKQNLNDADYIFIKGPLGFSEINLFSYSTKEILKYIAYLTRGKKVFSFIAGGHLTTTISEHNIPNTFSHTSLSGGATLAFLAGKKLPGIEALKKSS